MLRLFLLLCAFTIVSIGQSWAILGDDLPKLRSVYGSAKIEVNSCLFIKDEMGITVFFDGTTSAMEVFCRDPHAANKDPISEVEIDKILNWEGKGQTWTQSLMARSGLPVWIRADNKILARISYQEGQRVLVVMLNEK